MAQDLFRDILLVDSQLAKYPGINPVPFTDLEESVNGTGFIPGYFASWESTITCQSSRAAIYRRSTEAPSIAMFAATFPAPPICTSSLTTLVRSLSGLSGF